MDEYKTGKDKISKHKKKDKTSNYGYILAIFTNCC